VVSWVRLIDLPLVEFLTLFQIVTRLGVGGKVEAGKRRKEKGKRGSFNRRGRRGRKGKKKGKAENRIGLAIHRGR
jgi:hypothetical protein